MSFERSRDSKASSTHDSLESDLNSTSNHCEGEIRKSQKIVSSREVGGKVDSQTTSGLAPPSVENLGQTEAPAMQ